jgi:hypothetical protein
MMNISHDSMESGGLIISMLFIDIWIAAICTTVLSAPKYRLQVAIFNSIQFKIENHGLVDSAILTAG